MEYKYRENVEYNIYPSGHKTPKCIIVDCEHDAKRQKMCKGHYNIIMNICTARSCDEVALDDGSKKCQYHRGNQNLDIGEKVRYKILPSGHKQRLCTVDNCEKAARKGGMCNGHKNIKVCPLDKCPKLVKEGGSFCEEHDDDHSQCKMCDDIYEEPKDLFGEYCDTCKKKKVELKKNNIKKVETTKSNNIQNKEILKEKRKIYRENNKEKIAKVRKEQSKRYYNNNKKILSEKCKLYRENNQEAIKESKKYGQMKIL